MTTKHKVKRVDSNHFLYRGKRIEKSEHIPHGYGGHYTTVKRSFSRLSDVKAHIDSLCQKEGKDSFMTLKQEQDYIEYWKE